MTKLWHWTRGSVFTAVLMHAALNFATARLIDSSRFDLLSRSSLSLYLTVIAAFAALALVFWALDIWVFRAQQSTKRGDAAA